MRSHHLMILVVAASCGLSLAAQAQDAPASRRTVIIEEVRSTPSAGSSSESQSTSGVGFRGATTFAPKYKQRLQGWIEQIQIGESKGWLTIEEIASFKTAHGRLTILEEEVSKKGYPKAELDDMEKQFTLFNSALHAALNKPAKPAAPAKVSSPAPVTPASPTTKPVTAASKSATKTTSKAKSKKPAPKSKKSY